MIHCKQRCKKHPKDNPMQNTNIFYRLFWLFKANIIISCLAVGGGYMIIPLIKKQFIDKKQAFSFDDLMEMSAVAQSAPGAIAINLAAITGYKIAGIPGAVISCIAAILPPLLIISAIASCYEQFIQNHYLNAAFKGMLAAIAAIIIDVVYDMIKNVAKNKDRFGLIMAALIFSAAFLFNINAILLIIISLFIYTAVFRFLKKDKK